jgi:uncharacterized paraquat-inducible protein A
MNQDNNNKNSSRNNDDLNNDLNNMNSSTKIKSKKYHCLCCLKELDKPMICSRCGAALESS